MRVLFSSTWGYGHVFPLVPLARAFTAAGHSVRWAASGHGAQLAAEAGVPAVVAGLDAAGVADVERRVREVTGTLPPPDRAAYVYPSMFADLVAPPMVADLLPLARDWRPDLLVHEHAELASPLVGAALGVPSVTHAFGGGIPAAFVAEAGERLGGLWTAHGLAVPPYAGMFDAPYVDICPPSVQTVPLDHVPRRVMQQPGSWTGPEDAPPPAWLTDPDHADRARPLVYLTLGTVGSHAAALAAAATGVAGLGARVLVTVGRHGDPDALGPQPDHVRVERWVPQSQVLPHCSVVVSHAGSGTCLSTLALGLPQLCLPQAADQFRNAAGVVRAGAGLALLPGENSPAAVQEAVQRLLTEEAFRDAAGVVAQEIRAMPEPAAVAAELAQR